MIGSKTSNDTDVLDVDKLDADVEDDHGSLASVHDDDDEQHAPNPKRKSLGHNETRVVSLFRIILLAVLVVLAVAISLLAYFGSRNSEVEDFEEAFASHAQKVIASFEEEAAKRQSAITASSLSLSSYAEHSNESWPFVALPDWEPKANTIIGLADIMALMVFPLVKGSEMQAWGEYSAMNLDWYYDGMAMHAAAAGNPPGNSSAENVTGIVPFIFTMDNEAEGGIRVPTPEEGPFFPLWQYSPQIPLPIINIDLLGTPTAVNELSYYLASDDNRKDILGPAFDFSGEEQAASFTDMILQRRGENLKYEGGPLSYFYTPVYERVLDTSSPLVAVVQAFIYWQPYFEGLLPDSARGIIAILENGCNQSYTFEIDGQRAEYVGAGDLHDSSYDYLEANGIVFGAANRDSEPASATTEEYDGCTYSIRVYPSKTTEDKYMTSTPVIVAVSMFAVFAATAIVFLLYDRFVEKRQKIVLETAEKSSEVVHKLFPENVRDRLYNNENNSQDHGKSDRKTGSKAILSQFLLGSDAGVTSSTTQRLKSDDPIADEYKHCTVYFADLAGFTKWSSSRTPSDVFFLLEALYGEFDKVARKRKVFKVETIGDCYVAVTGLPRPQKRHATIMCRFASICQSKMNDLINSEKIIQKLGSDTSELSMRVGMHSGPVTAGVLRGEKARFQLFGDTVNTAARMESNGQKGRIQVSSSTADALLADGKDAWLTAREDLIEAKGKGQMQTYWVEISDSFDMNSSREGSLATDLSLGSNFSINGGLDEDDESEEGDGDKKGNDTKDHAVANLTDIEV